MTGIFDRPVSHARILANIAVAVILAAVLIGLVFVIVGDRCSRNVFEDEAARARTQQNLEGANK